MSAAFCCCWSIYSGFIAGSTGPTTRGLLRTPRPATGMNVRAAMLVAAAWFAVFALPLLLIAHRLPSRRTHARHVDGVLGGYRKLWSDLTAEWRRDRNLVYYLIASAVFRDGLAASSPSARCSASTCTASRRPTC